MPGMFEKDKEFGNRLDQLIDLREPFILRGARVPKGRTIETSLGTAQVAELDVERIRDNRATGEIIVATTVASAIVEKATHATEGDFPCVVELRKVASKFGNDALVLQWLRDLKDEDGNDIPF